MNTTRVSNGFDPDQDIHSVGLHLGPNFLQMLSADVTSSKERVKMIMYQFLIARNKI